VKKKFKERSIDPVGKRGLILREKKRSPQGCPFFWILRGKKRGEPFDKGEFPGRKSGAGKGPMSFKKKGGGFLKGKRRDLPSAQKKRLPEQKGVSLSCQTS